MPPVALFWGAKDPIIPIRHGKDAVANSANITLTMYQGCGHYPQLDAPERFSRNLTEFLCDPSHLPARVRPNQRKKGMRDLLGFPPGSKI